MAMFMELAGTTIRCRIEPNITGIGHKAYDDTELFANPNAMCIMITLIDYHSKAKIPMERRLNTRHRARTTVYVVMSGRKSRICKAKNLSANGVFVETENLGLRKGQQVHLAFAINLGLVTKIHRRTAIVAHVTRGGTGLMMEQLAGR